MAATAQRERDLKAIAAYMEGMPERLRNCVFGCIEIAERDVRQMRETNDPRALSSAMWNATWAIGAASDNLRDISKRVNHLLVARGVLLGSLDGPKDLKKLLGYCDYCLVMAALARAEGVKFTPPDCSEWPLA